METTVIPTLQATFDKVATHLLTQNQQALSPAGNCKYRAGYMACAVGCLLTDAVYRHFNVDGADNTLEGQGVNDKDVKEALVMSNAIPDSTQTTHGDYLGFLTEIQTLHDEYPTDMWRSELVKAAKVFGLSDAVPTGFPA